MERGVIDGQESKPVHVIDPHRVGVLLEEVPIALLRVADSLLPSRATPLRPQRLEGIRDVAGQFLEQTDLVDIEVAWLARIQGEGAHHRARDAEWEGCGGTEASRDELGSPGRHALVSNGPDNHGVLLSDRGSDGAPTTRLVPGRDHGVIGDFVPSAAPSGSPDGPAWFDQANPGQLEATDLGGDPARLLQDLVAVSDADDRLVDRAQDGVDAVELSDTPHGLRKIGHVPGRHHRPVNGCRWPTRWVDHQFGVANNALMGHGDGRPGMFVGFDYDGEQGLRLLARLSRQLRLIYGPSDQLGRLDAGGAGEGRGRTEDRAVSGDIGDSSAGQLYDSPQKCELGAQLLH